MAKPREGLGDARRTWIFHIDDVVIDEYAPKIGVYGLAIYALLARHAKANKSFPSYRLITQKLGIGRATVVRALAKLEEVGLITKEVRYTDVGDLDSNLYTLLDLSHHRIDGGSSPERLPSSGERLPSSVETLPSSGERPGVVLQRDQGSLSGELEGISLKESQRKDLNTLPPTSQPSVHVEAESCQKCDEAFMPKNYSPGFQDVLAAYPADRRQGEREAWRIWSMEHLEPRAAEIVAKLDLLKAITWKPLERRFIPLMNTWFKHARYDDAPVEKVDDPEPEQAKRRYPQNDPNALAAAMQELQEKEDHDESH